MKRLFSLTVILSVVLVLLLTVVSDNAYAKKNKDTAPSVVPDPASLPLPLIAGQHYQVGLVYVWDDGEYLYVKYVVRPGCVLEETHLYVGTTAPEKSAPGSFKSDDLEPDISLFKVPLPAEDADGFLYIAAHAVVCCGDTDGQIREGSVVVTTERPGPGDETSYFYVTIDYEDGKGILGPFNGWCVEVKDKILPSPYDGYIGSSLGDPTWEAVNYVINNFADGVDGIDGREIQVALWILTANITSVNDVTALNNVLDTFGNFGDAAQGLIALDEIQAADIMFILHDTWANSAGWQPGPGDLVAFVIYPDNPDGQTIIITFVITQVGCETAWALGDEGIEFPKRTGWGTYFVYELGTGSPPNSLPAPGGFQSLPTSWGEIKSQ